MGPPEEVHWTGPRKRDFQEALRSFLLALNTQPA